METAETLFRGSNRLVGIDPATILMLIELAIKLWQWWSSHKVSEPSVVAMTGEPGSDE